MFVIKIYKKNKIKNEQVRMKRMFTVHCQSQVKSSRVKSAEHTLQREIYVATSHFSFSSDFGC